MTGSPEFEDPGVRHYVFIDDFCGSGTQAKQYSSKVVDAIHDAAGTASLDVTSSYYVLAATETGLAEVRSTTSFDNVDAVFELDDTHKPFEPATRYYPQELTAVDRPHGRAIAEFYGDTNDQSTEEDHGRK